MQKIVIALVVVTVLVLGRRFLPKPESSSTKPPTPAPSSVVAVVGRSAPDGKPAPVATTRPAVPEGLAPSSVGVEARFAALDAKIEGQSRRVAALYVLNQLLQFDIRSRHGEFEAPEGAIGRASELKARPQGLPRHVGLRIGLSGKASGPMASLPVLVERLALHRLYKEVTDGAAPVRIWKEELGSLVPCPARAELKVGSAMLDVSVQGEVHLGADRVRIDLVAWGLGDGKERYRVHEEGLYLEELVVEAMRQVARREIQAAKGR